MTVSLEVDFGIANHLMLMCIPLLLTICYPPCVLMVESALIFSMDFSALALRKWSQDFKKDMEIMKFKVSRNGNNPGILSKSN